MNAANKVEKYQAKEKKLVQILPGFKENFAKGTSHVISFWNERMHDLIHIFFQTQVKGMGQLENLNWLKSSTGSLFSKTLKLMDKREPKVTVATSEYAETKSMSTAMVKAPLMDTQRNRLK